MRAALALSLICSVVYAGTEAFGTFPGHWLVKAMSVALLAVLVRRWPALVAALLFGSLGDALLSLKRELFVYGLAAFLCGHIAYTAAFLKARSARNALAVPLMVWGVYGAAFYWWLLPALGGLYAPVLLYMVAITAMVVTSHRVSRWVAAGAVLFLISDSVLAANRFHAPVPLGGYIVWSTYYLGQLTIAVGCSRGYVT